MRTVALLFLLMTVIALAIEMAPLLGGTPWADIAFSAVGDVWFRLDRDSLLQLEPAISRHLAPELWSYGVQPALEAPVAAVLGALGVLFWIMGRPRGERRVRQRGVRRR